ncbi:MAG: cell division protein FtsQ/DivIB [Anaerolineales bacterium]|jgi:hypothetical protein
MIWERSQRSSSRLASKRVIKNRKSRKRTASMSRRKSAGLESSLPPVMVRGMTTGVIAGTQKAFNRSRRRIDIPLNVPGAEIRLPSIPQIQIGWRLFSFILVLLSGYLLYEFWNSEEYVMDIAELSGLKHVTSREVNSFLAVRGKPVFTLNPISIKKDLSDSFPEFSDVSVQVEFPNTLKIQVEEKAPVLVWDYNGLNMLIAEDGSAYQLRDESLDINQFPIVKSNTNPSEVYKNARAATSSNLFDQNSSELSFETLNTGMDGSGILLSPDFLSAVLLLSNYVPERAELLYDEVHGLMWEDERGWEVYFGDSESIEIKINVYKALFTYLKNEGLKPEFISVEYPHNPYYRLDE